MPIGNRIPQVQVRATAETSGGNDMDVDSTSQDLIPETQFSDPQNSDDVEVVEVEQQVAPERTTRRKRARKGKSATHRKERIPVEKSWGSEVDDQSEDDKLEEAVKKHKLDKKVARRARQKAKKRGSTLVGETAGEGDSSTEVDVAVPKVAKTSASRLSMCEVV